MGKGIIKTTPTVTGNHPGTAKVVLSDPGFENKLNTEIGVYNTIHVALEPEDGVAFTFRPEGVGDITEKIIAKGKVISLLGATAGQIQVTDTGVHTPSVQVGQIVLYNPVPRETAIPMKVNDIVEIRFPASYSFCDCVRVLESAQPAVQ